MREAVGGSLLFYIMLGIIAFFVIFIAFIMNYAATYRASNLVITKIEQTEGKIDLGSENSTADDKTLYGELKNRGYYIAFRVTCELIFRNPEDDNSKELIGAVYKVQIPVKFDLPLIGLSMNLPPIQNETKTIYGEPCQERVIGSIS